MKDKQRPNILWICSDSQRFDTLGCYGNPFVRTPHLDRLAEEGVLFERVYSQNPLCTPSRGCFLTGRYPVASGLRQNGQDIRPSEKLVTRLLADAGYVCGLSGKLHLSACDHRVERFGRDWHEQDARLFFTGTERRIDDGYAEMYWSHSPNHATPGNAYARWLQDKGLRFERERRPDCAFVYEGMAAEHHETAFCAEKAIGFIRAYRDAPYPWLFSVNMFAPHFEFDPPADYLNRYMALLEDIPLPDEQEGELDSKPPYQRTFAQSGRFGGLSARDQRMMRAAYWAMVDLIDFQVGRMLRALEETGQKDNTIVIFTSDHGEMLGDHGIYHKGPFLYDPAIHVPLIVSCPGVVEPGRRAGGLVELGDLAPTLLEAAGLPRYPGMQTRSFWDYMTAGGALGDFREDVYCEYYNSNPNKPAQYCTMVRTDRYKAVAWHGQPLGELYDLARDPLEYRNLWNDPDSSGIKTDMLLRLCDRMAWTADPLPERIGIY